MSESSGPHTYNTMASNRVGSVGTTMPGAKSQLVTPNNDDISEDQEVMMWGRHVMMGYAYREDATRYISFCSCSCSRSWHQKGPV